MALMTNTVIANVRTNATILVSNPPCMAETDEWVAFASKTMRNPLTGLCMAIARKLFFPNEIPTPINLLLPSDLQEIINRQSAIKATMPHKVLAKIGVSH